MNNSSVKTYPRVLTIAGSDSVGGAGIQADIKAISATGSYAASAITAVTVQNTLGVENVVGIPARTVAQQIRCVIDDIGVDAIKIGMLHSSELVRAVYQALTNSKLPNAIRNNIVLDPVMVSTSGHRLIEQSAIDTLKRYMLPMARVITPNIPEAEVLSGLKIETPKDQAMVAKHLGNAWMVSVWLKGGHGTDDVVDDVFYNYEEKTCLHLKTRRVDTPNTHGTGCTLSSALASYLAQGMELNHAVKAAKKYLVKALESGAQYSLGHGHGPVNHFWMIHK